MPNQRTRKRFALSGRSTKIDPRVDAVRPDLSDVRLASRVFAPHYAEPVRHTAVRGTPIRAGRAADTPVLSELLQGETFEMLELSRDVAWGISTADGVVGYIDAAALADPVEATHVVAAREAALLDAPDETASSPRTLPMGARVAATIEGQFARTSDDWLRMTDLCPLDALGGEPAEIAERLVGAPGKAGGRSGAGLNCTGLVFLSLELAGIPAPRFADLQAQSVGEEIADDQSLVRGDLVYFEDHVVIMTGAVDAIHVAADLGPVERVRLPDLVAEGAFGPIIGARRLP